MPGQSGARNSATGTSVPAWHLVQEHMHRDDVSTSGMAVRSRATTEIAVQATIPDPTFSATDGAVAAMLDAAGATYDSIGIAFGLAAVEGLNDPLLTRAQRPEIPTSGPPLSLELPRTAKAVPIPDGSVRASSGPTSAPAASSPESLGSDGQDGERPAPVGQGSLV
jgi:hypothetical protein